MKTNKLRVYSIVKYISYELLLEEQLQSKTDNTKFFERITKKRKGLKIKFLSYKIINSLIFTIQPIFFLLTYFDLNFTQYDFLDFHSLLFMKAVNFHFFFLLQLFNFFLIGLFNLTNFMSGDIYDWVNTLPLSRKDMKKLVFYSIYYNLNMPIITNTLTFPLVMLIATQNFIIFLISLGLSVLNMIFSLLIVIISGEKIAKFMKKHGQKTRKPLSVQLLNTFSYVLIIFGGIFVFEVVFNFLLPLLFSLTELYSFGYFNIILFLIPFPFNVSYLILLFTSFPQMHILFWLNLLYGFGLYLILLYFLIRRSFKSLGAVLSLKNKDRDVESDLFDDKHSLKINAISHFKAFIRKDLLIASRDLQTSMYFIMPIINSFTFVFFFNFSLIGGIGAFDVEVNIFFNNWLIFLGINPFISGLIVYNILSIDKSGKTIIDTLPIIRRSQAWSKMFIIILIQIVAVITPTFLFILHPSFIDIFVASLSALPIVITFSLTTFLMRIRFFGKKRYYYTLDENLSEYKTGKWMLILVINSLIYTFLLIISSYLFYVFNFLIFLFNEIFLSLIILLVVKGKFEKYFPKKIRRNKSIIIAIFLACCYVFAHILLLNSIISISLQFVIPIAFLSLIGVTLILKYIKFPKRTLIKILEKLKLKTADIKLRVNSKVRNFFIVLSVLFFAYSLFPIVIPMTADIYSLIGLFLVIFGLSISLHLLKNQNMKSEKRVVESKEFFQLDFLKAAMIFMVIFDHTIPWEIKNEIGVALWERIAIPVFLVIMGFNFGRSYKTRGKDNFGTKYFSRKLSRYLLPFVILYIISIVLGFYFYDTENVQIWLIRQGASFQFIHLFIGILPFWGPGAWFMPVLFSSIIILPIIFKGFSGKTFWALLSLILCFLIEMGMQYIVYSQFKPFNYANMSTVYMFLCNILYYTSAIGLGMWISRNHKLFSWHNLISWILFPLSLVYIIAYQFLDFRFTDSNGVAILTGDYNYLVTPYSAFLVLIMLKILPKTKKGIITRSISVIGKSTYHILLTQIMYFAILVAIYDNHYCTSFLGVTNTELACFLNLCVNWAICVPIGIIWWSIENSIRNYSRKKNIEHNASLNK